MAEEGKYAHVPAILNTEQVNRLSFDSESVQGGVVLPSAISTTDLKERGFSLDRDFVTEATITARIEYQKTRKPGVREVPYVSRIVVSDILGMFDDVASDFIGPIGPVLEIHRSPEPANSTVLPSQPENLAHSHVLSARPLGDGGLKRLRNRLLPFLQKDLVTLEQFLKERNTDMPS